MNTRKPFFVLTPACKMHTLTKYSCTNPRAFRGCCQCTRSVPYGRQLPQ